MKPKYFIPFLFILFALAYGAYFKNLVALFVGGVSLILYVFSVRQDDEDDILLTGLVAMFSSMFSVWNGWVAYLGIIGVSLLVFLSTNYLHVKSRTLEEKQ